MKSRSNFTQTMRMVAAVGLLGAGMIRPLRNDCDDGPEPVETTRRGAEKAAQPVTKPPRNGAREMQRRLRKMAKEPAP